VGRYHNDNYQKNEFSPVGVGILMGFLFFILVIFVVLEKIGIMELYR